MSAITAPETMESIITRTDGQAPQPYTTTPPDFNNSIEHKQSLMEKDPKAFNLVLVPREDISKTSILSEQDEPYKPEQEEEEEEEEEEGAMAEDYIQAKQFHLRTGFKKDQYDAATVFASTEVSSGSFLEAVQDLTATHVQASIEMEVLVSELQAMQSVASLAPSLHDPTCISDAIDTCARSLKRRQEFDRVLAAKPDQGAVIKALHTLVSSNAQDTMHLLSRWAVVYYTLRKVGDHIVSVSFSKRASGRSPKAPLLALFGKRAHEHSPVAAISPDTLKIQEQVCDHWVNQMRTVEQLAQTYHRLASHVVQFSLFHQAEEIAAFYDDQVVPAFVRIQGEFLQATVLSQLDDQIDYTHLNKALPKDNALTTAEERATDTSLGRLFSSSRLGTRQLIHEGVLVEFVSPMTAARKKGAAPPPPPKEYKMILTNDRVYLCEIVRPPPSSQKTNPGSSFKPFRLLHEAVLVLDSQISSTPDVIHPPVIQQNMVMVCFYNQTSYILQAKTSQERDLWVKCARQLNIEQPKPTDACRAQDEHVALCRSASTMTVSGEGRGKGPRGSLLKRLKSLRRTNTRLGPQQVVPGQEIGPDAVTHNEEEEQARRMQLGQPSLWEVRRLPADQGVMPPLEHPIAFRRNNLYDSEVKVVDLTTGRMAMGEFGMGVEDREVYFRKGCAFFGVLRPARLVHPDTVDKTRDDYFLISKRTVNGEDMCVEPPYITDFYARSWLHPGMAIEFQEESQSIILANMYRIICSSAKKVRSFEKYYKDLMAEAKPCSDNTFLSMDYRSPPFKVYKRIQKSPKITRTLPGPSPPASNAGGLVKEYNFMGDCHVEFRRMSNLEDALSIGFWNPSTKRDMSVGMFVFKPSTNTYKTLHRVSATELYLSLTQTDAQTTARMVKGQRTMETSTSRSLDTYRIEGSREALNQFEDFCRSAMGTDCKAREFKDTLKLLRMAFHPNMDNEDQDEGSHALLSHRMDGYLETLHEVEEETDEQFNNSQSTESSQEPALTRDSLGSSSTATFRLRSKSSLMLLQQQQQESADLGLGSSSGRLEIDPSSFNDLVSDGALSMYFTQDQIEAGEGLSEAIVAPSVADLTKFWAKTTSAVALVRSPSSNAVAKALGSEDSTEGMLEGTEAMVTVLPETPMVTAPPVQRTELEARMSTLLALVSHSNLALQAADECLSQANVCGITQATRYMPKNRGPSMGTLIEDKDLTEPGVDEEQLKPVADLKKRWEEIHRLGI